MALTLILSAFAVSARAQVGSSLVASDFRKQIAEAWAPSFFHDESSEFNQIDTGFNPVDTPLSFFFDGNQDVRDNGINVFRLTKQREEDSLRNVPVYYSAIETRTHFYLNYIVYHAIDGKDVGHVHDTENAFLIIEKDGSPRGRLVMVITNAHGFPMIYGPELSHQRLWRSRLPEDSSVKFLPAIDAFSEEHHQRGRLESFQRGASSSLKLFIARESHAIYKFNEATWTDHQIRGTAYFPQSCGECEAELLQVAPTGLRAVRSYELINFDDLILQKLEEKDLSNFFSKKGSYQLRSSLYRDRDIPGYLAAGYFEPEAKANFFYRSSFKTPFPLSEPASLHRYFEGESTDSKLSPIYLFNPYVVRIEQSLSAERSPAKSLARPSFSIKKASLLFFADHLFQ